MKNIIMIIIIASLCSCSVQQYAVNTDVKPFANGGRLFGEKTKGKEYKRAHTLYLLGINYSLPVETQKMAEELKTKSYTIESKRNALSAVVYYLTIGLIDYQVTKVIKR